MEKQEFERQLSAVREEIDRIDKQLLPLFLERMNCSEKVAEIKQQAGIPVLNAKREQEILDRVREEAGGYGGSAGALFCDYGSKPCTATSDAGRRRRTAPTGADGGPQHETK